MTNPETKSEKHSQKSKQRNYGGYWFLAVVISAYIITAIFDRDMALQSLSFFNVLISKVAPVLLLVFGLIFVFNYLFSPKSIQKYLGEKSGAKGWFLAIVGGILSTGPVSAWYVVLNDLRKKGMATSLAAAFLYSRAVKLPLLPLLVYYFGFRYTLLISIYLIGFSIINGLIMGNIGIAKIKN